MADLPETPGWEASIRQLEQDDMAEGGLGGIANLQATQLANRTSYLHQIVDGISTGDVPYTSIEEAQAAINAGKVPIDARISVRGNDGSIWVAEYQNINNVALPTGKVYPSKSFIDNSLKGVQSSLQNLSKYFNKSGVVLSEAIKTSNWTNLNTSGWAVGIKSDGSVLNYIEMWVENAAAIAHVKVSLYSRSVDGQNIFPGAVTDELLSTTVLKMVDIAMTNTISLGYQLVRFQVPPAIVTPGLIALFVIQPYDSNNNPVYMGNSSANINSAEVPTLSGALGGFWIDKAQTTWKVTTTAGSLYRIAHKIGFFSDAAEDEQAFIASKTDVAELAGNSPNLYKVGNTPQSQWYGFAIGFPGKVGFDVVTLHHQNLSAVGSINYRVFLRLNSAASFNTALGINTADIQIYSGTVIPPADSLESDFTAIDYPIPGLIIPDGYFVAIESHAHTLSGDYAYFGIHGHDYAGEAVPTGVAMGFYASVSSVVWTPITSYVGIAYKLSKASWRTTTNQVRAINVLTDNLSTHVDAQASKIAEMNSYPIESEVKKISDSLRWSYSTVPESRRFYQWAAPVHGNIALLESASMWLDGLSLNARIECKVYFRKNSLADSVSVPGITDDILALTADLENIPSTNDMILVSLPISDLSIPVGYFPILMITAYYSDGSLGNVGCGSHSNNPPASELGWYGRADIPGWRSPNAGSVAWSVKAIVNQTLQQRISELEGGVEYPRIDLLFPISIYNVANDIDYKVAGQTYTGARVALKRNFSSVLHLDNFIPFTDKEHPYLKFGDGNIRKVIPAYSPIITEGAIENPNLNAGQPVVEEIVTYSVEGNQPGVQTRTLINRSVLNSASKDKTPTILIIGDSVSFGQNAYFFDSNAKLNYTMILNRMFSKDKQQNNGLGYGFRTVGTIAFTDTDGSKSYNEAYSGTTLQGAGLFTNPKFLDKSGNFSFSNWLQKYRTCNVVGQRLYFDTNKATTGAVGENNKGYLEDGSDSGLLIGSLISNTTSIDVYEPTHVFCFHCSNGAISKADYDLFISKVRATFPSAIIGLGTPHVAGTYFPSYYSDVFRPAIWDYDQKYNNRQVATARVLLDYYCNPTVEANKVFVLPTMWVTPTAHAFSGITINEPWRDIVDGSNLLMPVGQRVDVHVGSKAQAAYAHQIYSWLKWTAAKGLF